MTGLRLVLDTNVLLSALLFPTGSLSWLRHAWQSKAILPLASRETTTELLRVLLYSKFLLTDDEREDLLADYLPWCETVIVSEPPSVPDCRDLSDRPFLELALVGPSRCPGDRRQPPARSGTSVFGSDPDPKCHQRARGPKMNAQHAKEKVTQKQTVPFLTPHQKSVVPQRTNALRVKLRFGVRGQQSRSEIVNL